MTAKELTQIIAAGENETVEFKAGRPLIATIGKIVTAFSNTKGGSIICGVGNNSEIVGLDEDQISKLKEFAYRIALNNIRPKINATLEIVTVNKKNIAVIEVPEGKSKPYGYKGTYFTREGSVVLEMAQADIFSFYGTQEKYDKRSISEILEKVKSIEIVLKEKIQNKFGTNIFISHGHHPEIRDKVVEFIESLELNPVVVMESASSGLSVDDKVENFIKKCSASIILYTPDDELKNGTFLPRQNVIHETGILQREMPDKIIYVKEANVSLPTNITPKVYVSFNSDNLTDVFIQLVKELKSFGIL